MDRFSVIEAEDRDDFEQLCVQAISIAAADMRLDPRAFVEELAHGEIGLLVSYLRAAASSVTEPELRADIESLLHRLTTWTGSRG